MVKEYIEREALIRHAEKQRIVIKDGTSVAEAMRIQGKAFRKCVETAPTADVVEVKHGEWVGGKFNDYSGEYEEQCSNCKKYSREYARPYCPNCGAKMDGGKKE